MFRRRLVAVAGASALLFGCLLVLVRLKAPLLLRADAAISAHALQVALAHPGWRGFMTAVTVTGGPVAGWTLSVVMIGGLAVARRWRDAVWVAGVVLASTLIRLLVLNTVDRPRPGLRLVAASGWSFPSGHTTGSAATAAVLIVVGRSVLTRAWQRNALTAAALGYAVAVGVSRVALVVHWPTDVLGAWLLVTAVVCALSPLRRSPSGESFQQSFSRIRSP
jgi:undecaprenyl-diphosphatase